jgi:hypothetical protein
MLPPSFVGGMLQHELESAAQRGRHAMDSEASSPSRLLTWTPRPAVATSFAQTLTKI